MDRAAVPRHPQVLVGDRQAKDPVITQAVVLRQHDLDRVPTQLELPTEPEHHVAHTPRLRHRRTLARDHHHEHAPLLSAAARAGRTAASEPTASTPTSTSRFIPRPAMVISAREHGDARACPSERSTPAHRYVAESLVAEGARRVPTAADRVRIDRPRHRPTRTIGRRRARAWPGHSRAATNAWRSAVARAPYAPLIGRLAARAPAGRARTIQPTPGQPRKTIQAVVRVLDEPGVRVHRDRSPAHRPW